MPEKLTSFNFGKSGNNEPQLLKNGSAAFPVVGPLENKITRDEMFELENRLRDSMAEITKPIYDK